MTIQFTRVFPNGRNALVEIDGRSAEVEALAQRFIKSGGQYLIMVKPGGTAVLAAGIFVGGEPDEAATEKAENGPALMDAVDRLVRQSVKHPRVLEQ